MGFINSGNTITLNAYLTPLGRDRLLSKDLNNKVVRSFSFGDSDMNYNMNDPLSTGNIPDLTGDDTGCIRSVAETDIRYKIKVFVPTYDINDEITDIYIPIVPITPIVPIKPITPIVPLAPKTPTTLTTTISLTPIKKI